ncbi:unnamed protein product, partial [Mesorhabditis belari]|uniref:Uncharacterized protein n=1 Tax=Mesorhabditis belari TaxID=2138241 RepID=A0AAF3EFC5_9BILA
MNETFGYGGSEGNCTKSEMNGTTITNCTDVTIYDDPGVDPPTAASMMGGICLIGIVIQALALHVVKHNSKLTNDVKLYFYVEFICRIFILFEHVFWGIPCGLWDLRYYVPLVDRIVSYLYYCQFLIVCTAQLMTTSNRVLAVIFDGVYYRRNHYVSQKVKMIVLFVGAALLYAPVFNYYWVIATFDTYLFSFAIYTLAKDLNLSDKFKYRSNHYTEIKLAIMMVINHSANALGVAAGFITTFSWFLSSFWLFFLVTFINLALYSVFGLNVVIFLRDHRRGRAIDVVMPLSSLRPPPLTTATTIT